MNWEATAVFGTIFLVAGIVLLVPLLWLVRRFVPEARRGPRVHIGAVVTSVVGLILLVAVGELFGFKGAVLFIIIIFALDFGVRKLLREREDGGSQGGI